MENENIEIKEETVDVQKYLDTINDLRSTTVSKNEFQKLKDENSMLLKSIMTGNTSTATAVEKPSAQELRNKLYGPDCEKLSDLEYVTLTCDLRDILLEEEGIDYLAPTGTQYTADANDFATANKLYNGFRYCIERADGDDRRFINELDMIMKESAVGVMNKLRRK